MSTATQSVLVIGGGSIGERHARCFLATGRARVAVCESRAARLAELSAAYPLAAAFPEWETAPIEEYSVVVVATPAPLHEAMAARALAAGCHVLVEKPLTLDVPAAERLAAAAPAAGPARGPAGAPPRRPRGGGGGARGGAGGVGRGGAK